MTDTTVERSPVLWAVWSEQLRVVGLAVHREAFLAIATLALGCLAIIFVVRIPALSIVLDGASLDNLRLDPGMPPWGLFSVFAALLLPILVWRGERPFGDSPLWSLPVEHRTHALIKVTAGWVWLMAILGAAYVCVLLTTLAAGGTFGADEIRIFITDPATATAGLAGPTQEVAWTTPWWEWVLPVTSTTAAYLLTSAFLLGTAHPIRWIVIMWFVGGALAVIVEFWEIGWIHRGVDLMDWYIGGDPFTRGVRLPSGWREGWTVLPSFRMWAASSAFWISLGLVSVLGATARRRDH